MNLKHLGTEYGGWTVDVDRIPTNAVIIDAGVGTDMSFSEGLHQIRPLMRSVLVDHTDESELFVLKTRGYSWTTFIKKAIAPHGVASLMMYKHKTRSGSESCSNGHRFADIAAPYQVPTISLTDLISEYKPCLIKLDIESAEYATIRECFGVEQVCCEFHHRMDTRFTVKDTENVIKDFIAHDYVVAHSTPTDEILFVRKYDLRRV